MCNYRITTKRNIHYFFIFRDHFVSSFFISSSLFHQNQVKVFISKRFIQPYIGSCNESFVVRFLYNYLSVLNSLFPSFNQVFFLIFYPRSVQNSFFSEFHHQKFHRSPMSGAIFLFALKTRLFYWFIFV